MASQGQEEGQEQEQGTVGTGWTRGHAAVKPGQCGLRRPPRRLRRYKMVLTTAMGIHTYTHTHAHNEVPHTLTHTRTLAH